MGHGVRHWVRPVAPGGTRRKRDRLGIRFPSIEVRSTESRFLPPGHAGRVGDGLKRAAVRQFDAVRHGACQHSRPKHHSCAHCERAAESTHTGQRPASRENSTDEQRKRWARPRRNRLARKEHELSKGNNRTIPPRLGRAKATRANSASTTPGGRCPMQGLGPGVLGSLGCRHGLGQAKTSIVEPIRSRRGHGSAPYVRPGQAETRAAPLYGARLLLHPRGPLPHLRDLVMGSGWASTACTDLARPRR